jgi:molybdate transport system ATP-binding protein
MPPLTSGLAFSVTHSMGAFTLDAALDVGTDPVAVIGPNGAGKSTLLLALLGIRTPAKGRIALGENVLFDSENQVDVPPEARPFAYLPQDFGLFPHLTAVQNVAFAISCRGGKQPRRARLQAASDCLARFGAAHLGPRYPAQLSGGERQRVALVRATATSPRALFLDEPTASLDVDARAEVRALLTEGLRTLAIPTLIVTHDVLDVLALASRVAVLEAGRMVACEKLDRLRLSPPTAFASRLLGSEGQG